MKKAIFSMRMDCDIREALRKAARQDQRSVSSLLNKIISDYLERSGFLKQGKMPYQELRKYQRKKITVPARIIVNANGDQGIFPIVILDLSKGGALVTYLKNTDIAISSSGDMPPFELCLTGSQADADVHFECKACYIREFGGEIRMGAAFVNPPQKDLKALDTYLN